MVHVARDRETEGAGLQGLAHDPSHGLELRVSRIALGAGLAHGVEADGRMTDERAHVDAEPLSDRLHVLGERLPRPGHARLEHLHRDRLDVGQHARQLFALLRLDGGEGERAVADDDRGGAVVTGVGTERVPHDLRVVVAVVVHEARGHDTAVGLDHPAGRAVEPSELHDLAAGHRHVTVEGGPTGSVDDAPVLDQEIVRHVVAPLGVGVRIYDSWSLCSRKSSTRFIVSSLG
jgi:hypothetical protein